ncbi:MAG: folate-binding protein YgfZ [Alphaproteobacteria bacterium]|nr:folate-binding protein YgfZ [Alphaproteobacteria bacterium]
MPWCEFKRRSVLTASGPDARTFLQGLVSVDVLKLSPDMPRYGLLLSPQGKFAFDFFLLSRGAEIWLESARAAELLSVLRRYRLRAAVELGHLADDTAVFAMWGDMPPSNISGAVFADPRLPELGMRVISNRQDARAALATAGEETGEDAYDLHRLTLGVPEGDKDMEDARGLPLEWGMDALHGIDFDKGCYVGQEVTARTRFRAQLRKAPFAVRAEAPLPPPGTRITAGGADIGELRSSQRKVALALLNTDALGKAGGEAALLHAEDVELRAIRPLWFKPGKGPDTPVRESSG